MADRDPYDEAHTIAQCLTAANRPLRLQLGLEGGVRDDVLLPQYIDGEQGICDGIALRIDCLSLDAHLPLKALIGVAAELQIVTDRGNLHSICGIVTAASQGESDGGLAAYQLVVSDALAILDLDVTTRVFLNKNELDVVRTVLYEVRQANPTLAIAFDIETDATLALQQYPARKQIIQCNESTGAFIRRLLRRRGISWVFRAGTTAGDGQARATPRHTMVLFHDARRLPQSSAGTIRFHRASATEQRDTITAWCGVRSLRPGRVSHFSWDYDNPRGAGFMTVSATSRADQGGKGNLLAGGLERYLTEPPHVRDNHQDLRALAWQSMARSDFEAKCYYAESNVRDCNAGEYFSLAGHPDLDTHPEQEREFIILSQRISAQNNLPKAYDARVQRLFAHSLWLPGADAHDTANRNWFDAGGLRVMVRLTCVRRDIPFVPAHDARTGQPHPPLQSAVVTGPEGEEVLCDALGRVRVRFGGTRGQDHAHAQGAGASSTDADSAWVRVASNWAGTDHGNGAPFGALTLPRAGTEVLIDFLGGDPDKPVIIGQLYNGASHPPCFGHDGLPDNRYLSGIKSREIRGQRANQLRLDDTPGQISAQLASDHGRSELNLGWLCEPRSHGAGAQRGAGAELSTDEQMALRAGKGVLLSAWERLRDGDKQLDRSEYLALMEECLQLFRALGQHAAAQQGLASDDHPQQGLKDKVQHWEHDGGAMVGVTAPDGISFASSQAIVSYAATNIDTVARKHLHLFAGAHVNLNAAQGIGLFAQKDGLRVIAHRGKLLMQSQHDDMEIDSGKDLRLSALGRLIIMAEEISLINTAGAYIRLKGGSPEIGGPGAININTDGHHWNGPASEAAQLPTFDEGDFSRAVRLVRASDSEPVSGVDMRIEREGGDATSGVTGDDGVSPTVGAKWLEQFKAIFIRKQP